MAKSWHSNVPRVLTELVDSHATNLMTEYLLCLQDDTWDDELDSQMCLITDHINIPPANNNALLLLQNPD
jgi:hypothetical protein